MGNAESWETLLYGLAGTSAGPFAARRDRILAALASVHLEVVGAAALDEAALEALPPHRLVIVIGDAVDDDVTFAAVPEAELDDDLRRALDLLDGASIDVGTPDEDSALWTAWRRIALATGARDVEWFAEQGQLDDLPDAIALYERWRAHAFGVTRGNRVDGARLDRRFTRVTFVIERI
jgi:hypothetical protein